jgi:hypothetical protein
MRRPSPICWVGLGSFETARKHMARARNIKPGFFKNADLAANGERAQLLFAGLWTIADKEGRLKDDPRWIRVEILPYSEIVDADVDALLNALATGPDPFINRYEVDGRKYLQVVNWQEHQSPHHTERESRIPEPPKQQPLTNGYVTSDQPDGLESIRGNPESIRGDQNEAPPSRKKFTPPTADEVAAYCRERGNKVQPDKFCDFYASKGWKIGKNAMVDWKAAVRNWEQEHRGRGSPASGSAPRTRSGFEIVPME